MAQKLKIVPLGGVSEIGKNLMVYEYGKDIIVVDCGSIFPTEEMPGIDLVIPDLTYLENNAQRIRGVFITHGHEDHIGAVPYLLKRIPKVPIYGTMLTLALIRHKLEEHNIVGATLINIDADDTVKAGVFSVEFIHTNHSIPGAVAMAIHVPIGVVIQTGDFKVDYTPPDGKPIDLAKFAAYGSKGVLCLLSDSTNADSAGITKSESLVGDSFEYYFDKAKARVIVATFSSNVNRVQQIVDTAVKHSRKVCFAGRSMINVSQIARELGYMHIRDKDIIEVEELHKFPLNRVCVITTGSQGEPMSGLSRMANNSHKQLEVTQGDLVILSSSNRPGNERTISKVINQLEARGAEVIYDAAEEDLHVSGHAHVEELKLMLALTKPKYFMPVHGEYRHLHSHAKLALDQGIPSKNIFMPQLGSVLEISKTSAAMNGTVPSGSVMIDGSGIGDIGNIVLRDRKLLSEDGIFVVVFTLEKGTGKLLAGPDVISRGFVYMRESEGMIDEAREVVRQVIAQFETRPHNEWAAIKNTAKNTLRDYLYNKTKRNPVILPIIMEV